MFTILNFKLIHIPKKLTILRSFLTFCPELFFFSRTSSYPSIPQSLLVATSKTKLIMESERYWFYFKNTFKYLYELASAIPVAALSELSVASVVWTGDSQPNASWLLVVTAAVEKAWTEHEGALMKAFNLTLINFKYILICLYYQP